MTKIDKAEREAVLEAFASSNPRPTAKAIIEHCRDFPHLAEEIRELATVLLQSEMLQARHGVATDEEHEADERDFSAVSRAMGDPFGDSVAAIEDFRDLIAGSGKTAEQVFADARFTGNAARDLANGLVLAPYPATLVSRFARSLDLAEGHVLAALSAGCDAPRLGMAKASKAPRPVQRSFAEAVAGSDMDAELRSFWLGQP